MVTSQSFLRVVVQDSGMIPGPKVLTVDGREVQLRPVGPSDVALPPGRHRVGVRTRQWFREYGRAELEVEIRAGEACVVYYAPPFLSPAVGRAGGRLGLVPQKPAGLGWLIACVAFFAGVLVVASVIASRDELRELGVLLPELSRF